MGINLVYIIITKNVLAISFSRLKRELEIEEKLKKEAKAKEIIKAKKAVEGLLNLLWEQVIHQPP